MSTLTKEWLLKTIAELEEERDATPGAVNEDAAMSLAAMKLALSSLEAKDKIPELRQVIYHFRDWNEGFPVERFKADYVISWMLANYPPAQPTAVSVPGDVSGPLAHAYKELTPTFMRNHIDVFERYGIYPEGSAGIQAMRIALDGMNHRAAILQGAERVSDRDELPDGWVACSERMPGIGTEIFYFCQDDGLRDCGIVSSSNFSGKGDAELYVHAEGYDLHFGVDISHWMPLPAAPQQEVK